MPQVHLYMLKRGLKERRAVAKAMTEAVASALKLPKEIVGVVIHEVTKEHYAVGGELYADSEKRTAKKKRK
ncbi:MAG: tautomerase family protein [Alphaproteobacteria bacterium]|nr:tautomerase family protein [Alphaproteobacteria bacterium]